MRGARPQARHRVQARGIIPADAGSTNCDCGWPLLTRDHPRGCGEHCSAARQSSFWAGSSPRMRGAHHLGAQPGLIDRIIPADAGSTSPAKPACPSAPDHPRGCGEHCPITYMAYMLWGSSPRMRGARHASPDADSPGRIIPADAGSTQHDRRGT